MNVHVIALGGTIASSGSAGVSPTIGAEELARTARVDPAIRLSFEQAAQVSSGSLGFGELLDVAARIDAAGAAGATGVVVTQGTDTLEESAFALSLLCSGSVPVVVTGAMRNPTVPGADGPANLSAAIAVAASPRAEGTLVVMADEIFDPLFVRKSHTTHIAAFSGGALGSVTEGRVRLLHRPTAATLFAPGQAPRPGADVPPVALVTSTLGDDLRLLRAAADAGYSGVVLAGVGGGHVPGHAVETVAEVAARIPVVLTGRPGEGEVLRSTYGYPGGEIDLFGRGLVPGGLLSPLKARVAASLLLAAGRPVADLAAYS